MAAGFQWKIRLIGITCKIKPIEIICHLFYFNRRDAGPHTMSLWVPPVAFIVSSKSLQTHGGSSSWFSIYFLFIFSSFFATFLMVCQSQVTWATLSGLRRSRASEQYERPEPNDGWQIRELVEPVPEPTTSFRRGPRGEENVGNGHGAYNIHSTDRVQYIHYDEWLSSGTSPLLP